MNHDKAIQALQTIEKIVSKLQAKNVKQASELINSIVVLQGYIVENHKADEAKKAKKKPQL